VQPNTQVQPNAQVQPHIPVAAQPLAPHFPFNHWPPQPWQQDPDTSQWPDHEDVLGKRGDARARFLDSWGHGNQAGGIYNGANWHGVKFLGAGGYGSAGLWVEIDHNRNIRRVSCATT
jgi:hypothetical protein